jgi:hypothetical protein
MDLCLPDGWQNPPGAVFRDDLGPVVAAGTAAPRHYLCGLCDFRHAGPRRRDDAAARASRRGAQSKSSRNSPPFQAGPPSNRIEWAVIGR